MPRSRRSHNRIAGDALVDDSGNEWHLVRSELGRDRIAQLLADPDVRVGVHARRALLRWIPKGDCERVWSEEIDPFFHDGTDQGVEPDAPQPLPFHGTLWRRRGRQMLVFDDRD
jgi:hypothetical protein